MALTLLTEHHLEFLSLKGGCTGSSESTLVKIPHCWKSHVAAHLFFLLQIATLRGTSLAVEHMRKDHGGKGGVVINIASIAGICI